MKKQFKILAEHVEQYIYIVEAETADEAAEKLDGNDFIWSDSVDQGDHVITALAEMSEEEIEEQEPYEGEIPAWNGLHGGRHTIIWNA